MSFNIINRAQIGNAETKPNEIFAFGYPVLNTDGTPYLEPLLVDVEICIYDLMDSVPKKVFNFANGATSHATGTNIINISLDIKDSELPCGHYRWTINHKRNINAVVQNKVMFSGSFLVTYEPALICDITECNVNTTHIANIEGLREELDSLQNANANFVFFDDFQTLPTLANYYTGTTLVEKYNESGLFDTGIIKLTKAAINGDMILQFQPYFYIDVEYIKVKIRFNISNIINVANRAFNFGFFDGAGLGFQINTNNTFLVLSNGTTHANNEVLNIGFNTLEIIKKNGLLSFLINDKSVLSGEIADIDGNLLSIEAGGNQGNYILIDYLRIETSR